MELVMAVEDVASKVDIVDAIVADDDGDVAIAAVVVNVVAVVALWY